ALRNRAAPTAPTGDRTRRGSRCRRRRGGPRALGGTAHAGARAQDAGRLSPAFAHATCAAFFFRLLFFIHVAPWPRRSRPRRLSQRVLAGNGAREGTRWSARHEHPMGTVRGRWADRRAERAEPALCRARRVKPYPWRGAGGAVATARTSQAGSVRGPIGGT